MLHEATPVLDPAFVDDFAHRWMDAWNRHDGPALAELCTEDIDFYDPAIGAISGREAVAHWVDICTRAFPDYRFEEPEPAYVSRDRAKVIAPWRMVATNTGPLDPPGFAPTGRSFVIDGVDHWWFRDGLVERYRADYDLNGGLRQLGLVPEPGSRGEKALVRIQRLGTRLRRRGR
ncbi:MAG: ester cyclase [Solirubrobacteraceae bacterium]